MDTFILSFQIRVLFIGLRGRILVNLYWKTFLQKVLKNTEEFLMQDVLKEEGGKGNHFEIPPADFLSDVDCAKKRRLAFLRNARKEMNSGSKNEKWCSSDRRTL